MDEKTKYPSYNGLSRVAMWWGIPLMAIVIIAIVSLMTAVVASIFLGPGGLLFGAVGLPFLLYLKQICETDDQAFRITVLQIICKLKKKNGKRFGNTYSILPMQFGRRNHVYQRNSK